MTISTSPLYNHKYFERLITYKNFPHRLLYHFRGKIVIIEKFIHYLQEYFHYIKAYLGFCVILGTILILSLLLYFNYYIELTNLDWNMILHHDRIPFLKYLQNNNYVFYILYLIALLLWTLGIERYFTSILIFVFFPSITNCSYFD